ncbi:MAG: hypothetical protein R2788_23210 [Saprospiraceae bacterium]
MKEEIILDDIIADKEPSFSKRTNLIIIGIIVFLAILNITIMVFILPPKVGVQNLDGTLATTAEYHSSIIKTSLLNLPIIGFLLGALFSFIPYKRIGYGKKYIRFSLIIILTINTLFFLGSVLNLAFWIFR